MKKSSGGFTLLEVIIAMTILTGVLITLSQTWSGNVNRVRKTNLANNVAILLERKMVELEAQYQTQSISEIPELEEGDFGKNLPNYTWKVKSRAFEMPDFSSLMKSNDSGNSQGGMAETMIKQISEFISKAVKEVTVSVIVTANGKSASYDVTTYFVDWNQDMALPGGGALPGSDSGGP